MKGENAMSEALLLVAEGYEQMLPESERWSQHRKIQLKRKRSL